MDRKLKRVLAFIMTVILAFSNVSPAFALEEEQTYTKAYLLDGETLNSALKTIAGNDKTSAGDVDERIHAIRMSKTAPDTDKVSVIDVASAGTIYAWFEKDELSMPKTGEEILEDEEVIPEGELTDDEIFEAEVSSDDLESSDYVEAENESGEGSETSGSEQMIEAEQSDGAEKAEPGSESVEVESVAEPETYSGVVYLWSDADVVSFGENASSAFRNLSALTDISGLSSIDFSETKDASYMFYGCSSMKSFSAIDGWNCSALEKYEGLFDACASDFIAPSWATVEQEIPEEVQPEVVPETENKEEVAPETTPAESNPEEEVLPEEENQKEDFADAELEETEEEKENVSDELSEEEFAKANYDAISEWMAENGSLIDFYNGVTVEVSEPVYAEDWEEYLEREEYEDIEVVEEDDAEEEPEATLPKTASSTSFPTSIRKEGIYTRSSYESGTWSTGAYRLIDSNNKEHTGICLAPELSAPADGTYTKKAKEVVKVTNPLFVKVLYYGYGGLSKGKKPSLVTTHIAAAIAYHKLNDSFNPYYRASDAEISAAEAYIKKVKKKDLPEGAYAVMVKTGAGYQILAYPVAPKTTRFEVEKISSDPSMSGTDEYSLKGAKFEVYNSKNKKVGVLTTKEDGSTNVIKNLAPGKYTVKEVEAPKGFKLNTNTKTVNLKEAEHEVVEFEDEPYPHGHLSFEKTYEWYGTPADGAAFKVQKWSVSGNKWVDLAASDLIKDNAHKWHTVELYGNEDNPNGRFRVVETAAPAHTAGTVEAVYDFSQKKGSYNSTNHTYEIKDTYTNQKKALLRLIKQDKLSKRPIKGAEFKLLQYSSSKGEFVNYATIGDADYNDGTKSYNKEVTITKDNQGRFYIEETKAPLGYRVDFNKFVSLKANDAYEAPFITVDNEPEFPYAKLTIVKTNKETGEVIKSSGTFTVYEWSTKTNSWKKVTTLTLSNGKYSVPVTKDALNKDKTPLQVRIKNNNLGLNAADYDWNEGRFRVVETKSPEGFINEGWSKEYTSNNTNTSVAQDLTPSDGEKVTNPPNSYKIKKTALDGTTPVEAVFAIRRAGAGEAKVNVNGREVTLNNTEKEVQTDANGLIAMEEIPRGTYYFREVRVITPGYDVGDSAQLYSFIVKEGGDISGDKEINVKNPSAKELKITKVSSTGELYNNFPEGTTFGVYEWDPDANAYKTNIFMTIVWDPVQNKFVDRKTKGTPKLRHNEKNLGKYEVREIRAAKGYILDKTPQYVEIPAVIDRDNIVVELKFTNKPNELKIKKTDLKGRVLAHVHFAVSHYSDSSATREGETGDDGYVSFKGLKPGVWYYKETATLAGFKLDTTEYPFVVGNDGLITVNDEEGQRTAEVATIAMENPNATRIRIRKVDSKTGQERDYGSDFPRGTVFEVYEWDKNLGENGDYKTIPIRKITFATEEEIANHSVTLPRTGKEKVTLPKTGDHLRIRYRRSDTAKLSFKSNLPSGVTKENNVWGTWYDSGVNTNLKDTGLWNVGSLVQLNSSYTDTYTLKSTWRIGSATSTKTISTGKGAVIYVNGVTSESGWNNGKGTTWCNKLTGHTSHSGKHTVDIYAWVVPKDFTITYTLNGGTQVNAKTTYNVETANFSLVNPTRTGYTFTGWTGSNGTTQQKTVTIAKGSKGNKSYTAHWSANKYTITLSPNGGSGGTSAIYEVYGTNVYLDSATTKAMTGSANAITKPTKSYTVTFNANGGSVSPATRSSAVTFNGYYDGTTQMINANGFKTNNFTNTKYSATKTLTASWGSAAAVSLPTPTRTGYTFAGWYTAATNGTKRGDGGGSYTPTATETLYAHWTPKTYTLTIKYNGADFEDVVITTDPKLTFGSTNRNSLASFIKSRNGFTFQGFYDAPEGGNMVYDTSGTATSQGGYWNASRKYSKDANLTVYAHWSNGAYTITYDLDGGSAEGLRSNYTVDSDSYTLPTPTKAGMIFAGWSGTGIYTTSSSVTIPKGSTGNRSYTAHWMENGSFVDPDTCELAEFVATKENEGKFMIRETQSTPGYILDDHIEYKTVEDANAEGIIDFNFKNTPNEYKFKKVDKDGNGLAGAVFEIIKPDGSTFTMNSDGDGYVILEKLDQVGEWHFQEIAAPEGYEPDDTIYDFKVSDGKDGYKKYEVITGDTEIEVPNTSSAFIKVMKQDSLKRRLPGVYFDIVRSDGSTDRQATKSNGWLMVDTEGYPAGKWTFTESANQPNYKPGEIFVDRTPIEFNVTAAGVTGKSTRVITNYSNSFTLKKEDENGNPIKGAKFRIWNNLSGEDAFDETITTPESGIYMKDKLAPGTWNYKEIKAADGYYIDEDESKTSGSFTVAADGTINGERDFSVTVKNPEIEFSLIKKDTEGNAIDGVEFKIFDPAKTVTLTKTTTNGGKITISKEDGITPGTWHYQEVKAPEGYIVDPTIKNVVIAAGEKPSELVVENKKNGLKIRKVDDQGQPAPNVKFAFEFEPAVEGTTGPIEDGAEYISGNDGWIQFNGKTQVEGLPAGEYSFKETDAPDTFMMNDAEYKFSVDEYGNITSDNLELKIENGIAEYSIVNERQDDFVIIIKKVDPNGRDLKDAEFELYKWNGEEFVETDVAFNYNVDNNTYASDPITKPSSEDLNLFKVVETVAPEGFIPDFEREFSAPANGTQELNIEAVNEPNYVSIAKVDENGDPLEGATFDLWKEGQEPESAVELTDDLDNVTIEDGITTIEKLSAGTYHFRENKVPEGYLPDLDENNELKIHDFVVNGDGYVIDADGNTTNHATFTVKDYPEAEGNIVIHKTDPEGNNLEGCEFVIYEWDEAENKYLKDEEHTVTMAYDDEAIINSGEEILKYEKSYVNTSVLKITKDNLGKFLVVETKAPEFFAPAWSKEVKFKVSGTNPNKPEVMELDVENPYNALKIIKEDGQGNKLDNVKFVLREKTQNGYDEYNNEVWNEYEAYTEDGIAVFEKLKAGEYQLTEEKGISGYAMDTTVWNIVVDEEGFVYEAGKEDQKAAVFEIHVDNPPNELVVLKVDMNTQAPLAGAKFTLSRYEGADNVRSGEPLEKREQTTGADGKAVFSKLGDGLWYLEEVETPPGYSEWALGSDEERLISVVGGKLRRAFEDTLVTSLVYKIGNGEDIDVNIKIEKVDIETKEKLEGAEFAVWPLDTTVQNYHDAETEPILVLTYDPDGQYYYGTVKGNQKNQAKFIVKETKAPEGYSGGWFAKIDGLEKKDWEFTIANGNPAMNAPVEFDLVKYDMYNEEKLIDGAVFEFWKDGDEAHKVRHVTGEAVQGKTEEETHGRIFLIDYLENGNTYHYQEVEAPDGYILDPEVHDIVVSPDGLINSMEKWTIEVPNEPRFYGPRLLTGGLGRRGIYVSGGVLLGIILLLIFLKKRKRV